MQNGEGLVRKAEKKLKGGGGFFGKIFGNKNDRIEEAIELYQSAVNHFKIDGQNEKAVQCLIRNAGLLEGLGDTYGSAECYMEAGELIGQEDSGKGLEYIKRAAGTYKNAGKIQKAAKAHRKVAQIYEEEIEYELAAENYKIAARLFQTERYSASDYNKSSIKVADLLSRVPSKAGEAKIIESIKIYEKIGNRYASENLLRHSAKELFFKASLLFLVIDDEVGMDRMMEKCSDKDPYFNSSMEKKFLDRVKNSYSQGDSESFTAACGKYAQSHTLDKWKTSILAQIKRTIEAKDPKIKKSKVKEGTGLKNDFDDDFDPM